jgi:hypothetical protein
MELWTTVTGSASGTIGTWVGGVCGLIGLFFVFRQARQAKMAATGALTAAQAATRAVSGLVGKLSLSHASYASGQLATLLFMVQHHHFGEAHGLFWNLKRTVLQAHPYEAPLPESAKRALAAIQHQLSLAHGGNAAYQESKLVKATHGLLEQLSEIEKQTLATKTEA